MKHAAKVIALFASFAMLGGNASHAMPAGNPPHDARASTSKSISGPTQSDINDSESNNFAGADREMNRVYQAVLKKHAGDSVFIGKIRAAQRAWLVFRDAEILAQFPDANPQSAYGSVYPTCVSNLKAELTMQRIEQLKKWRDGTQEGDVCAGSIPINGDAD